jgi:hypothetical protein
MLRAGVAAEVMEHARRSGESRRGTITDLLPAGPKLREAKANHLAREPVHDEPVGMLRMFSPIISRLSLRQISG